MYTDPNCLRRLYYFVDIFYRYYPINIVFFKYLYQNSRKHFPIFWNHTLFNFLENTDLQDNPIS